MRSEPRSGPIGPELTHGRGWYVVGKRSVQVIERADSDGQYFAVFVLFPGCRIDLRFLPVRYSTLRKARNAALDLAQQAGAARLEWPRYAGPRIDGVTCGDILCLEALG